MEEKEFIILCILGLILYFKMKYHWKFYLIENNEDLKKDINDYLSKSTSAPTFFEALVDFFRFPSPFFNEEIFNEENIDRLKKLRSRIYILLIIWWLTFAYLVVEIFGRIIR